MFKHSKKTTVIVAAAIAGTLLLTASSCGNSGIYADEEATERQLQQYQDVQPIPFYNWSQYRQTLISIQDAQAQGTATTSFFFNIGVQNPIKMCPSIGYPVATTTQLTSPTQYVGSSGAVVDQMEPTGVYTGDSSGTYVVCVVGGVAVPTYWEGLIQTEGGPAYWDREIGMIINDGTPTVQVQTQ
jgi:hypothetical protein